MDSLKITFVILNLTNFSLSIERALKLQLKLAYGIHFVHRLQYIVQKHNKPFDPHKAIILHVHSYTAVVYGDKTSQTV